MDWYFNYVGLPQAFNSLGRRESNCSNAVRTYCCYGYLQIYVTLWLHPDSKYRSALLNDCGVSGVESLFGLSNRQKLANACTAKVAYDMDGFAPWRL